MPENWQIGGFGLYVHWPFCASKCPYCDFNSHVTAKIDQSEWAEAYKAEIQRYATQTPDRVLSSIFFGGGTPSLMDPQTVDSIIQAAQKAWTFANDIEITLEANPSSIEMENFAGYKAAGVNRVSMGIQALNETDLRALGRLHSVSEAKKALTLANSIFDRVSFDLIYARQNQTLKSWEAELNEAIGFGPTHMSLYQLTIEPDTAFGARHKAGKLLGLPRDELATDMYFLTQEITKHAGLPSYEVSNHAQRGQESRHNMIYWRGGDWVGIGPGAHGRLTLGSTRFATATPLQPNQWLATASDQGGEILRDALEADEIGTEYLLMGLRTVEGIDLKRLKSISGMSIEQSKINGLLEIGLIELSNDRLWATESGRPILNGIIRELMPD
ncbi:radical SAM family heme chaperone HemW [Aliiroseovarius marinus]|uniref:radical SAM family heme chaperone HemW n=1 Tax=Aliiroseovarius marinus TaxID=2500159 RepID=UPI003D7E77A8